mmetsp:Transcript_17372/g.32965  ORF Transcript_17372/g.32965 Transcript_17372/m.32965 type:complete len:396 (-) Transcript_17372:53-1240(-)
MPKKAAKAKYKKAPGAPKRFKSSFMFYSEMRHKTLRNQSDDKKVLASDIAKIVSTEWKSLKPHEKKEYEAKASEDRDRYYKEKAAYKGPWKIPNVKDPRAPKKAQSAFLAFSNERRKTIAEANPGMGNAEISGVLSKLWKESPLEVKNKYREREVEERKKFKAALAEWSKQSSMSQQSESSDEDEVESPSNEHEHTGPAPETFPSGSQMHHNMVQPQQWSTVQHTESTGQAMSQMSNQYTMMERTSASFTSFLTTPFLPAQQQFTPFAPLAQPQASLPSNAFAAATGNQIAGNEEFASFQQQLISLPPVPVSGPLPTASSEDFSSALMLGGPSVRSQTAAHFGQGDYNNNMYHQQSAGMDEYPSLRPFIDTDTGGYLAAFAALERGRHGNSPNQN